MPFVNFGLKGNDEGTNTSDHRANELSFYNKHAVICYSE